MRSFWSQLPAFWKCQICGWAVYVLISIPVKWAIFGSFSGTLVSLYRELLGFLLTFGMSLVYRRIYGQWSVSRILLTAFTLSFVGSALEILISYAVHNVIIFQEAGFNNDVTRIGVLYYRAAVFAGWSFLYFTLRLYHDAERLNERLIRAVSENRIVEAQFLRSQMNPHFLFNALTTIRGSVERSRDEFRRVIQSLADYLRYSLDHGRDDLVTFGMEFDATCIFVAADQAVSDVNYKFRHGM